MLQFSYHFSLQCIVALGGWLLGCLLADMDEVAWGGSLAWDVCLEISIDVVLHLAVEGLVQQSFEALQTMRVVGQTEFTGKDHTKHACVQTLPNID